MYVVVMCWCWANMYWDTLHLITHSRLYSGCAVAGWSASCWPSLTSFHQSPMSTASQPGPTSTWMLWRTPPGFMCLTQVSAQVSFFKLAQTILLSLFQHLIMKYMLIVHCNGYRIMESYVHRMVHCKPCFHYVVLSANRQEIQRSSLSAFTYQLYIQQTNKVFLSFAVGGSCR